MPCTTRQAGAGQDLRQFVVDRLDQGDPVGEAGQALARLRDRGRVGVDADQAEARMRGQEGAGVTGAAERRVDEDGARRLERRREQLKDPVAHDRHVPGRSRSHRAPSLYCSLAALCCPDAGGQCRPAAAMPGQAPIRATALTGRGGRLTPGK